MIPLPPGHTDCDLLVRVPDADVIVAGDVIEESGPPIFGSGVHPLEWPAEVAELARIAGPATKIIPGHGSPVGRRFVLEQAAALGDVAAIARAGWDDSRDLTEMRRANPRARDWSDAQLASARDAVP